MVCPYALDRFGGVQHQALQLADWLRADGHEVAIVAPGDDGHDGAILLGGTTSIRANGSQVPIALHPGAARRAVAAVQEFDVVHVHEPLMPLVSLAVVLGDTPPRVGTFHADPPSWVRGSYKATRLLLGRVANRLGAVTAVSGVAASAIATFAEPAIVP
ncbi:MAG: glycosyltransferase, partial [Acidimicrobiia bacterium]|nr:glycosyltransferase [Acidimicrobiia bacterium]